MAQQVLNRIVIATQIFMLGNELVDGRMAVATEVSSLSHLLAIKTLAKPLVGVALAGNQMMSRRSLFGDSPTEFAGGRYRLPCRVRRHFFGCGSRFDVFGHLEL